MPMYRRGSRGQPVERIQARLKELGHSRGPVDGDFGPGTERAVKAFQRAQDLTADGKVGKKTWDRLFAESELKPAPPPSLVAPSPPATEAVGPPAVTNPYTRLNERRLSRVHPILASRGRCLIELCALDEFAVLITQGLRTWEEQDQLYAKGRTVPPLGKRHIVTYAKGGYSFHNFGLAFDIVILDAIGKADWDPSNPGWTRAGKLGKSVGLEWGGEWRRFKDIPHFQYICGLTTADCRALYQSGGLPAVWENIS